MLKPRPLLLGVLAWLSLAAACATRPTVPPPHPAVPAPAPKSDMGISNIDPRWSGFARYLQRLIERVQLEWDGILKNSAVYPPRGSKVEIKFALDSSGRISRIIKVDSTSSDQGRTACLAALTDPMPYGAWTPEMIRLLGKEQAITFTFLYQ